MRSCSVRYGFDAGTTSTVGRVAVGVMAARSRSGSKPTFGTTNGDTVCDDVLTSSVYPSGSAFATTAAASMVLAPGRFSTITGWPSAGARRSASVRATMSTALPGASVATMRTVLVGHCWAEAMAEKNKSSAATSLVTRLLQENYVRRTELKN